MDVTAAITAINYELRGTDEDAPAEGSDEWNYWLYFLNKKKNELYRDVKKNWPETFETRSIGTITASATPSYNIPADFIAPSGDEDGIGAYVINGTTRHDLTLVKPHQIEKSNRLVYISGINPQVLKFADEITATDQLVGGTLYIPGYYLPADLVDGTDDLVFPDPYWGAIATAAEVAYNDVTYEDKAEGLNNKANNLYKLMEENSLNGFHGKEQSATVRIPRGAYAIRGLRKG